MIMGRDEWVRPKSARVSIKAPALLELVHSSCIQLITGGLHAKSGRSSSTVSGLDAIAGTVDLTGVVGSHSSNPSGRDSSSVSTSRPFH
jgi:hypothetical protein